MCIIPKNDSNVVNQDVPTPEKTADPAKVGAARKQEDQSLFGGIPDLRVDRNTPASVKSAGSGLNLM